MAPTATHAGTTRPRTTGPTRNRVEVLGAVRPGFERILTEEALDFVGRLDAAFAEQRCRLLAERARRREEVAAGADLAFRTATRWVRTDPCWKVAPPAPGLVDRRVEVASAADRGSAEAVRRSGAQVWLADQEDATSPTWGGVVGGQLTLLQATLGELGPVPGDGRAPTVVVRPRGWHLPEKHLRLDGRPLSGALVDVGLYLFHCGGLQVRAGRGPYLSLPKLEGHLEARLWNDVLLTAQALLGLPRGTVRATVVVETLPAAFEMEEILFELREHCSGLALDPRDLVASALRTYGTRAVGLLARGLPGDDGTGPAPFLRACSELLVATCHRRGAHAVGAPAAPPTDGRDPARSAAALGRVREDLRREAGDGYDGSSVAHPDLVPVCREAFDAVLRGRPNQVHRHRPEVTVTATDLLDLGAAPGETTADGLRRDVSLVLHHLDGWLRGQGTVAWQGLLVGAADAEAARWRVRNRLGRHRPPADGRTVTGPFVEQVLAEELRAAAVEAGPGHRFAEAARLLGEAVLPERVPAFLTTAAYARHLVTPAGPAVGRAGPPVGLAEQAA